MTITLQFQPVGDGDVDEVMALWARCGLTRPWNNAAKDMAFARAGANSDVLMARLDGDVAASVMVGHDGHRGSVYYVSVEPALQGRGFGRQTMTAAEAWLNERGVWKLNLLLRADNAKVRGFYEAMGYEVEPRLCMARKLTEKGWAQ
jgi:ribosomal protein S18 acetylase RimI-like enzyme